MLWSALLLAASATQPTVEEVKSAAPVSSSSCVWFLSGVCICTDYAVETVEAMTCVEDTVTGEFTCSYNVLMTDHSGLEGKHWQQRADVFGFGPDGELQWISEATEPVIHDSFGFEKNPFASRSWATNPRRSLKREW